MVELTAVVGGATLSSDSSLLVGVADDGDVSAPDAPRAAAIATTATGGYLFFRLDSSTDPLNPGGAAAIVQSRTLYRLLPGAGLSSPIDSSFLEELVPVSDEPDATLYALSTLSALTQYSFVSTFCCLRCWQRALFAVC